MKKQKPTAKYKKKLKAIYRKLKEKYKRHINPEGETLLDFLVYNMLAYRCPITSARKIFRILTNGEDYVDWNEVRVTPERDLQKLLSSQNCEPSLAGKIQSLLSGVFHQFHEMSLDFLKEESQEKCRKCLMELDGLDKPLAVWLLRLSHHYKQFPIDDRAFLILIRTGAFPPEASRTKMEKELKNILGVDEILPFYHVMIEHGKKTCSEDGSMKCKRCFLNPACDYYKVTKGRHPKEQTSVKVLKDGLQVTPPKKHIFAFKKRTPSAIASPQSTKKNQAPLAKKTATQKVTPPAKKTATKKVTPPVKKTATKKVTSPEKKNATKKAMTPAKKTGQKKISPKNTVKPTSKKKVSPPPKKKNKKKVEKGKKPSTKGKTKTTKRKK